MEYLPTNTEKELLERVSMDDEQAFTELFNNYKGPIYTTVLKLSGSQSVAEELIQDVFLKIWLRRKELPKIQNFSAYLYKVATRDTYRRLKYLAQRQQFVTHGIYEKDKAVLFHTDLEYELEKKILVTCSSRPFSNYPYGNGKLSF